tara:strand:- start:2731 stop:2928 length:198 start_codon:yes stop_codon:yes gene_type:complete
MGHIGQSNPNGIGAAMLSSSWWSSLAAAWIHQSPGKSDKRYYMNQELGSPGKLYLLGLQFLAIFH